jgi:serine protease
VANASVSANGLGTSGFQESASGLNPVRLRGSASSVALGRTVASYEWIQVSGEQVMTGTRDTADVDLPAATSTSDLVFQLTVTDSVGENHSSFTAIRVVASGDDGSSPSSVASASSGGTTAPTTDNSSSPTASVSSSGGGGGGGANTLGGLFGLMILLMAFKILSPVPLKE